MSRGCHAVNRHVEAGVSIHMAVLTSTGPGSTLHDGCQPTVNGYTDFCVQGSVWPGFGTFFGDVKVRKMTVNGTAPYLSGSLKFREADRYLSQYYD